MNSTINDIKALQTEAKNGELISQYKLANCYYNGVNVNVDAAKAIFWYEKSISLHKEDALFRLAYCYEKGFGVKVDLARSLQLYKMAAQYGNIKAINWLINYTKSRDTNKEEILSVINFFSDVKNQSGLCSEAQLTLFTYLKSQSNYLNAERIVMDLAGIGNKKAQYELTLLFVENPNVEFITSSNHILHLLLQLSDSGNKKASILLANLYLEGRLVEKNEYIAIDLLRLANESKQIQKRADVGSVYAQYIYAQMAFSYEDQYYYYRASAINDYPQAYYELSKFYNREGIFKDKSKSRDYLAKAAKLNVLEAQIDSVKIFLKDIYQTEPSLIETLYDDVYQICNKAIKNGSSEAKILLIDIDMARADICRYEDYRDHFGDALSDEDYEYYQQIALKGLYTLAVNNVNGSVEKLKSYASLNTWDEEANYYAGKVAENLYDLQCVDFYGSNTDEDFFSPYAFLSRKALADIYRKGVFESKCEKKAFGLYRSLLGERYFDDDVDTILTEATNHVASLAKSLYSFEVSDCSNIYEFFEEFEKFEKFEK
jgi:TPR repeat protein